MQVNVIQSILEVDSAMSYSNEKNLLKAIAKKCPSSWRFVTVCNRAGRYTAVFQAGSLQGDVAGPARAGFLVI